MLAGWLAGIKVRVGGSGHSTDLRLTKGTAHTFLYQSVGWKWGLIN